MVLKDTLLLNQTTALAAYDTILDNKATAAGLEITALKGVDTSLKAQFVAVDQRRTSTDNYAAVIMNKVSASEVKITALTSGLVDMGAELHNQTVKYPVGVPPTFRDITQADNNATLLCTATGRTTLIFGKNVGVGPFRCWVVAGTEGKVMVGNRDGAFIYSKGKTVAGGREISGIYGKALVERMVDPNSYLLSGDLATI